MASIERDLTDRPVRFYKGRVAILMAAAMAILAVAIMASFGRTVADESTGGTTSVASRSRPATCRHAVALPKRGWVCIDGADDSQGAPSLGSGVDSQ